MLQRKVLSWRYCSVLWKKIRKSKCQFTNIVWAAFAQKTFQDYFVYIVWHKCTIIQLPAQQCNSYHPSFAVKFLRKCCLKQVSALLQCVICLHQLVGEIDTKTKFCKQIYFSAETEKLGFFKWESTQSLALFYPISLFVV